ncbi:MAG: fused MFS/spermidine synthase [Solirubrobacteraceae bacterium]|nr:fused MFS/spermidine synthase [Solirubrobacteraceae bacterium]
MATLGAEIATARLLAPAFGSSTVIWANTIAIVLVALALGAWLGGRMADRGPRPERMYALLLGGAGLLALTPILATPLLSAGGRALDDISAPGFFGSLVAVLILVATPLALLGAVTPYTVRLALDAVEAESSDAIAQAGRTAGRLSALGTGGSLVGTFLSALALIPLLGTRRTFLLFALVLALVAAWGLLGTRGEHAAPAASSDDDGPADPVDDDPVAGRPVLPFAVAVPAAIFVLLLLPVPTIKAASGGQRLLEERETNEQYARVLQSADGTRTMELGEGHAIHSLWRRGTVMTGLYWDELLTLPYLSGRAPKRVLILGNAGGTAATAMRALEPQVHVDAVDYDHQLAELGKRWFGLGGDRLQLLTGDARVELRRSAGGYDAIIVDAYRQPYIPFHLSTREFFTLARERLAPGGVVIVNVGHPEGDDELEKVLAATMRAAGLRTVLRDPAQDLNTQLVGAAGALDASSLGQAAELIDGRAATGDGIRAPATISDLASLGVTMRQTAARLEPARRGGPVYTDDKAPVELLIDGSLAKVATAGS